MNQQQREQKLQALQNTSADDAKVSLQKERDPQLLCDLVAVSRVNGKKSHEQAARRRIAQLIKAAPEGS